MIDPPKLVWGAMDWLLIAASIAAILLVLVLLGYRRGAGSITTGQRVLAACLKLTAIALLAACLLEPLFSGTRARPGANKFAILADNSQSMTLKDQGHTQTRGDQLKSLAGKNAPIIAQIGRDFDLHLFDFDTQLRSTDTFAALPFDGQASDLGASLDRLLRRYQGQPLAGILLFTDGNATDPDAVDKLLAAATAAGAAFKAPPIYPVLIGTAPAGDIGIDSISVSETNFEDAPVTVTAQVLTSGEKGRNLTAELLDEKGNPVPGVERQTTRIDADGTPIAIRFKVKPEPQADKNNIFLYKVRVVADGDFGQLENPTNSAEATLANNARLAVVDRGKGPYKILYVAGRINPEFKFLQRALSSDDQIALTGLIRVAKREPKFNFISRDQNSQLFRGFDQTNETTEQFDQPVIQRVTGSGALIEPHATFPKTAEELDDYHAVILDDVESEFFSQDQMNLLREFVRTRGGGFLMLGGQESFKNGKYDRTPIGDILPVYCDEVPVFPADATFRLSLTREGWLEPWLRLRPEEIGENRRIDEMPEFRTLNAIRGIKPGATVMARATADGLPIPEFVEHRFGHGRAGALLVGDFWQWQMRKPLNAPSDFEKAWRQTIRWLVSDVPQRLDVAVAPSHEADDAGGTMRIVVNVRDALYAPLDNATVMVQVTPPSAPAATKPAAITLCAEPSLSKPGQYETAYVPRIPGGYRAVVTVTAPDGADIGQTATGWSSDPAADEFRALRPNLPLLERIAKSTGGQVVAAADLETFAAALPTRHAQVTETYVQPFWHQSWVFLIAILCLAAEWTIRRLRGMP